MLPAPMTSPSTRRAAPKPSISGPSWTRRTSSTDPIGLPSESTTALWSSSAKRTMATPGDVAHDVVSNPTLTHKGRHVLAVQAEGDVVPDVGDAGDGYADGIVAAKAS